MTQNKLLSLFRWPEHGVSSKSALDLHMPYTHQLHFDANTIHDMNW